MKIPRQAAFSMAGPASSPVDDVVADTARRHKADYKEEEALKSCHSEFHHILWCGLIPEGGSDLFPYRLLSYETKL